MKTLIVATVAGLALSLGGCATRVMSQPPGVSTFGYGANVTGPLPAAIAFYAGPAEVGTATSASKRGQACMHNVLGLVAWGDASIDAAKNAGAITRVASVEQLPARVLGYYAQFCTVVRGE